MFKVRHELEIEADIAKTKELLAKQEEELRSIKELSPAHKLAEVLHSRCMHDHTEGCSWMYEKWGDKTNGTRMEYLRRANSLIEEAININIIPDRSDESVYKLIEITRVIINA